MQCTLRLSKDSVDTQDMIQDFVEQYKGNIQFFFIEHLLTIILIKLINTQAKRFVANLQSGFDMFPQILLLNRHVVLGQPVAVQNWSLECLVSVDVGEVLQGD